MKERNTLSLQPTFRSSFLFLFLFLGIIFSILVCYNTLLVNHSYTIFYSEEEIENVDIHLTDIIPSLWNK